MLYSIIYTYIHIYLLYITHIYIYILIHIHIYIYIYTFTGRCPAAVCGAKIDYRLPSISKVLLGMLAAWLHYETSPRVTIDPLERDFP